MPAHQPLTSQDASRRACRICLDDEGPFISPCHCRGTSKFVHRACLDEWRAQQGVPLAFTHCSVCRFEYEVTDAQPEPSRLMRFRIVVARDTLLLFVVVQTVVALFAIFLHALDRGINCKQQPKWSVPCNTSFFPDLFPHEWADRTSIAHLSLGPYYVSSLVILLAVLGMVGLFLWCTNRLPQAHTVAAASRQWQAASASGAPPVDVAATPVVVTVLPTAEIPPATGDQSSLLPSGIRRADARVAAAELAEAPMQRRHNRRSSTRGPCDSCNCAREPCAGNCGNCGDCGDCICNGGDCKCDGDGALALVLVAFVIFVLIGVFVGVFFASIAIQRIIQRHVHLLNMRTAAQRFPVVDLAHRDSEEGLGSAASGQQPPQNAEGMAMARCASET